MSWETNFEVVRTDTVQYVGESTSSSHLL